MTTQGDLITVRVNGDERRLSATSTVASLLKELGVPAAGTAVEVGNEIVAAPAFAATELQDGHTIEIVRLVGGG